MIIKYLQKVNVKSMELCKKYEIMVIETNEIHNIRRCGIRKI